MVLVAQPVPRCNPTKNRSLSADGCRRSYGSSEHALVIDKADVPGRFTDTWHLGDTNVMVARTRGKCSWAASTRLFDAPGGRHVAPQHLPMTPAIQRPQSAPSEQICRPEQMPRHWKMKAHHAVAPKGMKRGGRWWRRRREHGGKEGWGARLEP